MQIKIQLAQLLTELEANPSIAPNQISIIRNTLCTVHTAEMLLTELKTADAIIYNCISNMTDEQRLQTAIDNHLDHLPAQWAFRRAEREEMIAEGHKVLGGRL